MPQISLRDFDARIDEITAEVCTAAERVGFFAVVDHGIRPAEVRAMFATAEAFFALPDAVKATVPWNPQNVGWEKNSQVRPSTGAADRKESLQVQFGENMLTGGSEGTGSSMWLGDEHLPGFRADCLRFMHRVQGVSNQLMVCLARGLGFPDDYFLRSHDPADPLCQNVLRLLHYFAAPEPEPDSRRGQGREGEGGVEGEEGEGEGEGGDTTTTTTTTIPPRAGAHADWGLLTLLFQREGQGGLEICPGREAVTRFALGDTWTRVPPPPPPGSSPSSSPSSSDDDQAAATIVCNIGDMLMSWSDDRFQSTFHRVKAPCEPGDYYGERYSLAFFNQPSKETLIQGPRGKYPPITGRQFIANAMRANFLAAAGANNSAGGPGGTKEGGEAAASESSRPVVSATA